MTDTIATCWEADENCDGELTGREDWRQPVSKTDCGAPTTPTCYWPGECSSHDGQAISAVVTA